MNIPIFALDIGTRTVIGIVGQKKQQGFFLDAVEVMEHESRSMLDGQIQNINQVALIVEKVKEQLEEKTGIKLTKVAVAAAGRALKTVKFIHHKEINNLQEINKEDVFNLEIEAASLSQQQLANEGQLGEGINSYHCIGYSVIDYYLEDSKIGDLLGQYGQNMGVQIIATFLPRIVVDSLYTVLKKADLEISSLSLEPIAASKVIIPQSMRQLNIALVDIGAGTSDIAVTKNGSITSYAMVPIAGDEITEALCHEYLLDFNEGERVKRLLTASQQVEFTNILGENIVLGSEAIIKSLRNIIDSLANKIAEQIITINEKPPQAVFCIGGGSQIPSLTETIAIKLGLPPQRAAIKGKEIVLSLEGDHSMLIGPEAITPLGIAFSAGETSLRKVEINGKIFSFINTNKPTVADALLAANLNLSKLFGRPGSSMTVEVNDEIKIIKGSMGTGPLIKIGEAEVALEYVIHDFCRIAVEPGSPGGNAQAKIVDLITDLPKLNITVNDQRLKLVPQVFMNSQIRSLNEYVVDGAKIKFNKLETVADVLVNLGYDLNSFTARKVIYYLNERQLMYNHIEKFILLNNRKVALSELIKDFDMLQIVNNELGFKCIKDLIAGEDNNVIKVTVNNKQIEINNDNRKILKNDVKADLNALVLAGDRIRYERLPTSLILADLLNYLNFNTKPDKSSTRLLMLINEEPAQFTSKIKDGDEIILDWK